MFTLKGKSFDFPPLRRPRLFVLTLVGAFAVMMTSQLLLHLAEDALLKVPVLSTSLTFVSSWWLVTHVVTFVAGSAFLWKFAKRDGRDIFQATRATLVELKARFREVAKTSVAFYALAMGITIALYMLLPLPKPHSPAAAEASVLTGVSFAIFALTACISAPLLEELFFRGMVQNMLRSVFRGRSERFLAVRDIAATLLAAALFAFIHGTLTGFPPLFITGLMCGLAYLRTGTLWAAVGVHFCNNIVAVAILAFAG